MPRTRRPAIGGLCYHVINRGNARADVFHDEADYAAFLALMAKGQERAPMRVLAYCLMPNHFHLVLWPQEDGDLGAWMQWLMTVQVTRHHQRHGTEGHLWQGRFKSFPIQADDHLLTVLRYVENNASRAGLVARAEDWAWASIAPAPKGSARPSLDPGPVPRTRQWRAAVNKAPSEPELTALRACVNRGRPWGGGDWVRATADRLGLASTLNAVGRPRKVLGQKP